MRRVRERYGKDMGKTWERYGKSMWECKMNCVKNFILTKFMGSNETEKGALLKSNLSRDSLNRKNEPAQKGIFSKLFCLYQIIKEGKLIRLKII